MQESKPQSHWNSFSKANATAIAATVVDFATLYGLVEWFGVYYVLATGAGAVLGAVTNFSLNRHWAFEHEPMDWKSQGLRYALVALGSLLLNTSLVFVFTEFMTIPYLWSKAITALLVGWAWNYPLHRVFVFPAKSKV